MPGQSSSRAPGTLLILSQVYVPDPASVGQHMHDAAAEMARRGWRVVVYTSARGYENPAIRYEPREVRDGVVIRRLGFSSFGKGSIAIRLLGAVMFLMQAFFAGLFTDNVRRILVSTSPPMCSVIGLVLSRLKRVPVDYWVMDINPDQMIAIGKLGERSLPARAFDWLNVRILKNAEHVIALDRYMAERLNRKYPVAGKLAVIPPWPHIDDVAEPIPHESNPFRAAHGLAGKFVFMYSGNLSPVHPVTTILQAALRLAGHPEIMFVFIGGGEGKQKVQAFATQNPAANIRILPYQPLDQLPFSLSAADVHFVSMGDKMVGVVHPCKVYGALAVGRPICLIGPVGCHVADILEMGAIGWRVAHGDVEGAAALFLRISQMPANELREMGARGLQLAAGRFSKRALLKEFCDTLEGIHGQGR